MKKIYLLIILSLYLCSSGIKAQTESGYWFINPQVTAFDISGDKNSLGDGVQFKFGIGFNGGRFIAKNLATLVGISLDIDKHDNKKDHTLGASAGLRYYLFSRLFLGGNFAYEKYWFRGYEGNSTRKRDYFLFSADAGYAIFLKPNLSLDPSVYWRYSFADKKNEFGVKLGFNVYF